MKPDLDPAEVLRLLTDARLHRRARLAALIVEQQRLEAEIARLGDAAVMLSDLSRYPSQRRALARSIAGRLREMLQPHADRDLSDTCCAGAEIVEFKPTRRR